MDGVKILVVMGILLAVVAIAATAIVSLATALVKAIPIILMIIGAFAIARMLVRHSSEETPDDPAKRLD